MSKLVRILLQAYRALLMAVVITCAVLTYVQWDAIQADKSGLHGAMYILFAGVCILEFGLTFRRESQDGISGRTTF